MVERSGNIDNIFKDGLKEYSPKAPDAVWNNISVQMKSTSKVRFLPIALAVAASVIAVVSIGVAIRLSVANKSLDKTNKEIVSHDVIKPDNYTSDKNLNNTEKSNNTQPVSQNTSENISYTIIQENPENEIPAYNEEGTSSMEYELSSISSISSEPIESNYVSSEISESNIINSYQNENDMTPVFYPLENTKRTNRWVVGGEAGPMYTYREVNSDYQTESTYNSAESGLMAYAGGVNVKMNASKRFTVQTGVYYSKIGQSKNQVYTNDLNTIEYKVSDNQYVIVNSTGTIRPRANKPGPSSPDPGNVQVLNNSTTYYSDEVSVKATQYFEYIEIPVYFKYKVINKKIDFQVIGGLSTNILIDNDVVLEENGSAVDVGSTENINPFNYSSTFGLGIEYPFTKNLSFSFQPVIKYYLNTINKNPDVEVYPYSVGILTGINYSF